MEVIVVVAIIGLVFGASGLAFASLLAPRESEWRRDLRGAREQAIVTGTGADLLTGAPLDAPK